MGPPSLWHEAVLATLPDLAYVADTGGRCLYANARLLARSGLQAGGVRGLRLDEVGLPPEAARRCLRGGEEVVRTGRAVRGRVESIGAGGGGLWYAYSLAPVHAADGRVQAVAGTVRDVSERCRVLAALEQRLRYLEAALCAVPDAAFTLDRLGRLRFGNRALLQRAGLAQGVPGEGVPGGRCLFDLGYPPDVAARLQAAAQAVFVTRQAASGQVACTGPDGGRAVCEHCLVPVVAPDGSVEAVAGTIRFAPAGQATEVELRERLQRSLEAEQHARAEAEHASRMKEEFLATLSHELRTPLSAIVGWAQLLRTRELDPQRTRDGVEAIARSARAQTQIIEDLLDMSAIVSGKVRLALQAVDLAQVVRDALDTVRPMAEAKGVALSGAPASGLPLLAGDPGRLQQVLWNLLSNAIKFTPQGGQVTVALEHADRWVEFSVSDTGEGIAPEFQAIVFDRFRQVDARTTRRHGGLGLGLAICRQLADMHGGALTVSSAGLGQGSRFTLRLPVPQVPPLRGDATAPGPAAGGTDGPCAGQRLEGVKVLVVDDDPDTRALLSRVLDECEACVQTASSAREALERLHDQRPDVLLSDIGMPDEDGYTLIRRIRALDPGAGGAVPAIALTAYTRAEDRIQAVRAGFDLHLAKPVEPAEVVTMVASLVRRRSS